MLFEPSHAKISRRVWAVGEFLKQKVQLENFLRIFHLLAKKLPLRRFTWNFAWGVI